MSGRVAWHMRRSTVALLALCASACLPFLRGDDSLRVLVFNIHAGKDAEGRGNLEQVATLVRSTGADVVLLQEVDRGTKRSGGVDQLQVLMDATGHGGVFGRTLDYDGGLYGIASLAEGGFRVSQTYPLAVTPAQQRSGGSYEPRGALMSVASTRLGRFWTFNTHLDASGDDRYRRQEVTQLVGLLRGRLTPTTHVAAGGDLNSEPGTPVVQALLDAGLRDAWAECGQGDGFTYPAAAPVKRIDYLFISASLRCTDAQVIDTRISDHRPLLVTLRKRS